MHSSDPSLIEAFQEHAQRLRGDIEQALDRYARYDVDCPDKLREAIRHSLLAPGKRLRPLLVLMAAEACGSSCRRAIPAACAVEMIHTYSLIHDDLPAMDDDDMRRGLPSCHARYGEAVAILAGDALLAQAFEILARDLTPATVAARCCAELARAAGASALVGGQVDDLEAEFRQGDLAHLEAIHRRKTGALFLASLRLGGLVAEATGRQLEALTRFGQSIGLAFQITDDLLDLQGDPELMGKRTGKDEGRGKLTFPSILGVELSRQRAEQLVREALGALDCLTPRGATLEGLARYVLLRSH
jgi:geranylgeranyl diphosphate synthase, type II